MGGKGATLDIAFLILARASTSPILVPIFICCCELAEQLVGGGVERMGPRSGPSLGGPVFHVQTLAGHS
jgi:hypothetical protein